MIQIPFQKAKTGAQGNNHAQSPTCPMVHRSVKADPTNRMVDITARQLNQLGITPTADPESGFGGFAAAGMG